MRYLEAEQFLEDAGRRGIVPGLDAVRALLERLDNPQDGLNIVHVAGTNGKGSFIAFLDAVLRCAGYRTGCFTSPALETFRDCIRVNGVELSKRKAAALIARIRPAAEAGAAEGLPPTRFELETAAALLHFRREGCGVVLLECGLGGRLDATNVIGAPLLSVLMPIGLDHTGFLGNTLEAVAQEKCGIIKKPLIMRAEVVSAAQRPEVAAVIRRACAERGCTLTFAGAERIENVRLSDGGSVFDYTDASGGVWKDISSGLLGAYQPFNAAAAIEAAVRLNRSGVAVSREAAYAGLAQTKWFGRFSVLCRDPFIVADGAHNPDGAAALRESVLRHFGGRRTVFIMAVFRDKDYEGILKKTAGVAALTVAVSFPDNKRMLEASALCAEAERLHGNAAEAENLRDAVRKAAESAGREGVVVAFGSLSFLAKLRGVVQKEYKGTAVLKSLSI